jgi:hypothetical protein
VTACIGLGNVSAYALADFTDFAARGNSTQQFLMERRLDSRGTQGQPPSIGAEPLRGRLQRGKLAIDQFILGVADPGVWARVAQSSLADDCKGLWEDRHPLFAVDPIAMD